MGLVRVLDASELSDGDMRQVEVPGAGKLAIYRVDGEFFATNDACTHSQASLGEEGYLEGHKITCTWHDGAFDIRTGEVLNLPCVNKLKTYPVEVKDGAVHVAV